jgi:hypothetical protein
MWSVLTVAAFWLLWISVPADPQEPGSWLNANSSIVAVGLNLVPFAGIAFLWFIASCATASAGWKTDFLRPCFSEAASCSSACCSAQRRSSVQSSWRSPRSRQS